MNVVTRQCVHCNKDFSSVIHNKRYCSEKCQYYVYNRKYNKIHNLQKYKHKSTCSHCMKSNRRVRKSDNVCASCINIAKYGISRKSIVGICNSCNRGPLTLSSNKCKSCVKYGKYTGLPYKTSQCELILREMVRLSYPGDEIVYNYRPVWLRKPTSNTSMEMDVALPKLKIGFEFDGRPHLDSSHPGYEKSHENDLEKTRIASVNGWTIIKIGNRAVLKSHQIFDNFLSAIDKAYDQDQILYNLPKNISVCLSNNLIGG